MEVSELLYTTMGRASHYLNSDDRNYTTAAFTTSSGDNTTEDIVRAGCLVDPFSLVACIRYCETGQSSDYLDSPMFVKVLESFVKRVLF